MILIASSASVERRALMDLCSGRGWSSVECSSVHEVNRVIRRFPPRVILVRFQLQDGFSDDVIEILGDCPRCSTTKLIVMLPAGTPPAIEARQVALGADCIQRDPIRTEVMLAFIGKFREKGRKISTTSSSPQLHFSGATFNTLDRTLTFGGKTVVLTPREGALLELVVGSAGEVITYEMLYNEVLGQQFRGNTANMRVLLAKLSVSASRVGLAFRDTFDVIPKTGYRYNA